MVTKQKQQLLDALNEYRSLGITKQIDYTQSAGPIKPLFGPTNRFSFPITERVPPGTTEGQQPESCGIWRFAWCIQSLRQVLPQRIESIQFLYTGGQRQERSLKGVEIMNPLIYA